MADIDNRIQQAESEDLKAKKDLADAKKDDVRSVIAIVVIFTFVGLVALVVLAAMAGTYYLGWEKLVEPGKYLVSILSSVMLPVVTLVIGYYFGSK